MITADVDRSELARVLIKQQFRFAMGMMYVECMHAQLQAVSALAAPASC